MEHVNAFGDYSQFAFVKANVMVGFPAQALPQSFDAIVLHYSLFGAFPFQLGPEWQAFIRASRAPRIAFFQDEHVHCVQRMAAILDLGITSIYSLLDPEWAAQVYPPRTGVSDLKFTLTGYVADSLIEQAKRFARPWTDRTIDVGFRGRQLSRIMGRQSQEKTEIARDFARLADGRGLKLDLETTEGRRFYGDDWHRFVGDCRFMLGVEAGVSVFDLDGKVSAAVAAAKASHPELPLEDLYELALEPFEGLIPYRTVSPRVFEAIAFHTALVLYEGAYNGVVEPYKHYIPLRKDHSNTEEVFALMADAKGVQGMIERAYSDVIASGRYCYRTAMESFDSHMLALGLKPATTRVVSSAVQEKLDRRARRRRWWLISMHNLRRSFQQDFPGRAALVAAGRRIGVIPPLQ